MRIDLPRCGLQSCRFCFDGNCTNQGRYESCEVTVLKKVIYARADYVTTQSGKYEICGVTCLPCIHCNPGACEHRMKG